MQPGIKRIEVTVAAYDEYGNMWSYNEGVDGDEALVISRICECGRRYDYKVRPGAIVRLADIADKLIDKVVSEITEVINREEVPPCKTTK